MMRWLAILPALLAVSATTRTVADHHVAQDNRSESERSTPLVEPVAAPPAPVKETPWVDCAHENKICRGTGWAEVRYGKGDRTRRLTVEGDVRCDNDTFGDPAPAVVKRCARRSVSPPLLAADITPIASNFETSAFFGPGYERSGSRIPPSGKPDAVGAFRMICNAGQLNYDDPILYPGVRGGSPHLHQWFGNLSGRYDGNYANLRRSGDSTCSNKLNRSAYWVPALMNAAGQVIRPDFVSLYYKRRPDGDPECLRQAAKGCVGLPVGLRAVSGYDMQRMGKAQPDNQSFSFRCTSPHRPSEHRATIAAAVADCGGAGEIAAAIHFGDCWTGTLDSADHRSHLSGGGYGDWGYYRCPKAYPYVIPQLTQTVIYTVQQSDGEVWFASDRMHGMKMPNGSTFHADYAEAWDPGARTTWERECIGKLLNCSDGELGNGTMLKREPLTYKANVRIVQAPVR